MLTLLLIQAFSTKLNEQKAEVDEFKEEIDRKFCAFDKKLKTQQTAVEQREADIDTLKSISAGTCKSPFLIACALNIK